MSVFRALPWLAAAAAALLGPPRPASAADTAASLEAKQAYLTGVELDRRRRSSESLPYFRRALALRPDLWQVHCDYAAALVNAVGEARSSRGAVLNVTRSSWERAAMIHQALAAFDRAERLAWAPLDRAYVVAERAQTFAIWGLGWNGLSEYARAQQMDSTSAALRERRAALRRLMRDPQGTGR